MIRIHNILHVDLCWSYSVIHTSLKKNRFKIVKYQFTQCVSKTNFYLLSAKKLNSIAYSCLNIHLIIGYLIICYLLQYYLKRPFICVHQITF